MKIILAFLHQGPGRGEIRARVYRNSTPAQTLTVGDYRYRQALGHWTARLWAVPGEPEAIAADGLISAPDVARLSNAAAARGKWWA